MEPQIQYCRTSDGVDLAYYSLGDGPGLLVTPPLPLSHLQLEWESAGPGDNGLMRLSSRARVVRYDSRGFGLSQRDVADFSAEALALDIEAAADANGLDRFVLYATTFTAPAALLFAARFAQRVSHLLLWHGVARGADAYPQLDYVIPLLKRDWDLGVDAFAHLTIPWESRERMIADMLKESATRDTFVRFLEQFREIDVSPVLGGVRARTLVVFRRDFPAVSLDVTRRMAAAIPGATFLLLPGSNDFLDDESIAAMQRFVLGESVTGLGASATPGGTAVILFADIADSTALTERIGDAAFRERARALDDALRAAVRDHGGAVVDAKTLGDGILATFPAASHAIAAALACGVAGDAQGVPLHLGLHAGDVIRESDNVFGGAVNIAARISALAAPGEVLVSRTVAELGRTSAGVAFEDRGEHALKGVGEPQRVFAVRKDDA